MPVWKTLLELVFSKERREIQRTSAPQLAAYYWTGAAPKENGIRDISPRGLYLLTEDRWYPGTLLMMTLQVKGEGESEVKKSISVQAKVVRFGEDGVGLEFLLPTLRDPRRGQSLLESGADKKTLEKFLEEFVSDTGSATINYVMGSPGTNTIEH